MHRGGLDLYIYVEYLLLENFIINIIILYVTGKFTKTETSKLRLIIASSIGALYTLVIFSSSLRFMITFIAKIAISILIIIIGFNPSKLFSFIKLISTFYIVSFVFAGASLALFYFTDIDAVTGGGIFYIRDFPLKKLFIAIVISVVLIKYTLSYIQNIISKEKVFIPISIDLNNKKVKVTALMDTGNHLKEPISNTPVIVAEFAAIKELLPISVQDIFIKYKENNLEIISNVMSGSTRDIKFRLIPFKSLGQDNGMLLGFKPDKVTLENEEERILSNIVIGIYNNSLSSDNKYMALLHPEILN